MKAGSARLLTGKIKHLDFSVDDWRRGCRASRR
jgi:hypothetical protein